MTTPVLRQRARTEDRSVPFSEDLGARRASPFRGAGVLPHRRDIDVFVEFDVLDAGMAPFRSAPPFFVARWRPQILVTAVDSLAAFWRVGPARHGERPKSRTWAVLMP